MGHDRSASLLRPSRAALLGLALLLTAGCASDRPRALSMIKADGNRAMSIGQYDRAEDFYGEWAERAPFDSEAHVRLGESLLRQGLPRRAREKFELAFEIEVNDNGSASPETIGLLAESLIAADDADAVRVRFAQILEDDPSVANYLVAGRALQRVGSIDDAKNALEAAARVDGGQNIEPQLALADFYRDLGDSEQEILRLRMALYLDTLNASINDRLRELGQIPGPSLALEPAEAR